ncbi:unnamed protein product [Nesidiocoris tenuis]|uniref:GPI ethanolamine phosphate transferase 1 n=1 Tax=Nesidiocoris tenuis TaxID=355587 RepID=A0A6H5H7A5_9HEMI|nr:unnamed protein product [Nesidiocoris tenuis]
MYRLLGGAVVAHCILLLGMFDVYFKSPIIAQLPLVANDYRTPASRLVLFIGDGLRSDHFYNVSYVPFLKDKIESGASSWGVSHTRVPTESRPGTVAIASGVYEDPSAVFKGWQHNPVPVDSFFNRCKYSFAWGSPDIVHLFSRQSTNVFSHSYNDTDQRFDAQVSLDLNLWVLNEFKTFVQNCKGNVSCNRMLHDEKVSFFFHFIGIDMSGHKSKPFSESYVNNIALVDSIIRNITTIFAEIFPDDKTVFLFTSDHGMTDWGSHGAAWGSGVNHLRCPKKIHPNTWNVSADCMRNVSQADIAVLMSTLLGVEIPTNCMGSLPTSYLGFDDRTTLSAAVLNANQLIVLYRHLEDVIKRQVIELFFFPNTFKIERSNLLQRELLRVDDFYNIAGTDHKSRMMIVLDLIEELKHGIGYYQNYFQRFLLFLLSASFVGLIATISGKIYDHTVTSSCATKKIRDHRIIFPIRNLEISYLDRNFLVILLLVSLLYLLQSLPWLFYVYIVLPVILWWKAADYLWTISLSSLMRSIARPSIAVWLALLVGGVELMVTSFFHRWVLSIGMAAFSIYPFAFPRSAIRWKFARILWSGSSLLLAVFPLLPTVGVSKQTALVVISGLVWLLIAALALSIDRTSKNDFFFTLTRMQMFLIVSAICNVIYIDSCYSRGIGLTDVGQFISWALLLADLLVCMLFLADEPRTRVFSVSLALGVPFLMLSVSFESLFLPILTIFMVSWFLLETSLQTFGSEMRKGFFFLFLIIFSFFGIGNIDSINSFDINWVRCFTQVFSPFTMTALIILKTVIPFLLVSCFLRLIVLETKADPTVILLFALVLCEAMGLQFLFAVRNTGSWLEIGTSISHYVIMEVSAFCLVILYTLSGFIVKKPRSKQQQF